MTAFNSSRAVWRKSTYSGQNGNCVEVARDRPAIAVRDSKDPDGPKLVFPSASWLAFTGKLKARH